MNPSQNALPNFFFASSTLEDYLTHMQHALVFITWCFIIMIIMFLKKIKKSAGSRICFSLISKPAGSTTHSNRLSTDNEEEPRFGSPLPERCFLGKKKKKNTHKKTNSQRPLKALFFRPHHAALCVNEIICPGGGGVVVVGWVWCGTAVELIPGD